MGRRLGQLCLAQGRQRQRGRCYHHPRSYPRRPCQLAPQPRSVRRPQQGQHQCHSPHCPHQLHHLWRWGQLARLQPPPKTSRGARSLPPWLVVCAWGRLRLGWARRCMGLPARKASGPAAKGQGRKGSWKCSRGWACRGPGSQVPGLVGSLHSLQACRHNPYRRKSSPCLRSCCSHRSRGPLQQAWRSTGHCKLQHPPSLLLPPRPRHLQHSRLRTRGGAAPCRRRLFLIHCQRSSCQLWRRRNPHHRQPSCHTHCSMQGPCRGCLPRSNKARQTL